MSKSSRPKFVTVIETDQKELKAEFPFKLHTEERRKFIRLEVEESLVFDVLKHYNCALSPQGTDETRSGVTINLSEGGMLIDTIEPAAEGSIIAITLTLQQEIRVGDILARVKRLDSTVGTPLMGIEFVGRDDLSDCLSSAELELLDPRYNRFEKQVNKVLANYVKR